MNQIISNTLFVLFIISAIPLAYGVGKQLNYCNFYYPDNSMKECAQYDPNSFYRLDCTGCYIIRQGII